MSSGDFYYLHIKIAFDWLIESSKAAHQIKNLLLNKMVEGQMNLEEVLFL